MKAVEFIKKRGWDMAKIHLDVMDAENWHNGFYDDLKRLIEGCELVKSCGGLNKAKKYLSIAIQNKSGNVKCKNFLVVHKSILKQAIADVESVELS